MQSISQKPNMGVLRMDMGERKFSLTRHAPSEDLAFFVKHYWIVNWDLTGQQPYPQDVVPNPCVNMVVERSRSAIHGPAKGKYSYLIKDKGCVFGVKFKPGGFYPFIQQPVSELSGSPINVIDVFDISAEQLEQMLLADHNETRMVELAEQILRRKLPEQDDHIVLINQMIDHVNDNQLITKVDQLCDRFDINKRKLQRLFDLYVGVSPKWVIQLYRIHNAVEKLDNDRMIDRLQLSLDLGYYDQSHFIKDFKMIIGKTPEEYIKP
jgi:AraC-like DNA-binding protein